MSVTAVSLSHALAHWSATECFHNVDAAYR
jgi:hypothetical protein